MITARVAGDARGEARGGQLPDRRAGISVGYMRGPRYGMPEGQSSSHFAANERKKPLQTQKTQLEVLTKPWKLSWVSSITVAQITGSSHS